MHKTIFPKPINPIFLTLSCSPLGKPTAAATPCVPTRERGATELDLSSSFTPSPSPEHPPSPPPPQHCPCRRHHPLPLLLLLKLSPNVLGEIQLAGRSDQQHDLYLLLFFSVLRPQRHPTRPHHRPALLQFPRRRPATRSDLAPDLIAALILAGIPTAEPHHLIATSPPREHHRSISPLPPAISFTYSSPSSQPRHDHLPAPLDLVASPLPSDQTPTPL